MLYFIVVTLNLMCVQVFRLRRKSHSLLDDPRIWRLTLRRMLAELFEFKFLGINVAFVVECKYT